MRRYVLTGAAGAGKTSILRALQGRGHAVVEEAATDVIAVMQARGVDEPWKDRDFLDSVVELQRRRKQDPVAPGVQVQIFDRSPLCTLALARYLELPIPPCLADEVARVTGEQVYQRTVFLVRPVGFVQVTAARRISYPDSLVFEAVHEEVYREHGYDLLEVSAGDPLQRAAAVEDHLE